MNDLSTRPYLIRAIYDWCVDSGLTPYLAVRVDERTEVPPAYVKDGEIVLNLGAGAVRNLEMGNEMITCNGRFGGVPFDIMVPVQRGHRDIRQRKRTGPGVSGERLASAAAHINGGEDQMAKPDAA